MALLRLGEEVISSMDDNVRQAELAKQIFQPVLEEFLTCADWGFATLVTTLAPLAGTPIEEYKYAFQLPTNCLRPLSINKTYDWSKSDYFIVQNNQILTDDSTVILKYIAAIDTGIIPPSACAALACLLASRLATSIVGNPELGQTLLNEYEKVLLPRSRYQDNQASKNRRNERPYSQWRDSRIYSTSG